ncbi:MAG: N-acetylmuramoyl-L-alanine amidase [Cyanobacteria bacterium J06650_10]
MAIWRPKACFLAVTLVLSALTIPALAERPDSQLDGIRVLLNPGHGGPETGAVGPTGVLAKDVSLTVSLLLQDELLSRGAVVVMTRETDVDISLTERQQLIAQTEPALALTIHYTSVEEDGDAEGSQGVRSYWYHPQSHGAAMFLHNHLVEHLGRVDGGIFWNNLALTRPSEAPAVVLELGFMTNPEEFEWITDEDEQRALARVLADGIVTWLQCEL